MPEETYSLQRLLALRKLTRGIADLLRAQLKEYLGTLAPLVRPKALFGDYVQGAGKDAGRIATDKVFQELDALYQSVAKAKPYTITRELAPPIEIAGVVPELIPVEYPYPIGDGTKTVQVTSPLRWVLAYPGLPPSRLKEVMAARIPDTAEVQRIIVHYAALNIIFSRQPGIARLFEALRFPLSTIKAPEFGELPLTSICAPIRTLRPPDDVIIDSTEMSGKDVFEEVMDIRCIGSMADPLRDQVEALARDHGFDARSTVTGG
jgi:hypothetical protein